MPLPWARASACGRSAGLTFSESAQFVGNASDASGDGGDGSLLTAAPTGGGSFTAPVDKERSGLRYLQLILNSGGYADLNGVSLNSSTALGPPTQSHMVSGRLRYAARHDQPNQGQVWPPPSSGCENNRVVDIGIGATSLKGATRDE